MRHVTKAVILVGGWGTRLRPLTCTMPKPLISFCNKPMLVHQIERLARIGIRQIILALNYYSELIIDEVRKYEDMFGVDIVYSKEEIPLGTAGPLALARTHLTGSSFFLLNSDICCNADLNAMKSFFEGGSSIGVILTYSVSDPSKYGLINVSKTQIISFEEKPEHVQGNGPWIVNAGIYVFSDKVLDYVELKEMSIEKDVFPKLANAGLLQHFYFKGYWMDIGQPKDYLLGQRLVLENMEDASENPCFDVKNNVVFGRHVRIGKNCRFSNCTIFDYTIIEDNVTVDESIIGWGCHIRNGCTVKGTSVLGEGVLMGSGTVVDNMKVQPHTTIY